MKELSGVAKERVWKFGAPDPSSVGTTLELAVRNKQDSTSDSVPRRQNEDDDDQGRLT